MIKFLERWWGALLAVTAAIIAGVAVCLFGRRRVSDESLDAAVDDVRKTAAEGEDNVSAALAAAAEDYADALEAREAINDNDESLAEYFNRTATGKRDGTPDSS